MVREREIFRYKNFYIANEIMPPKLIRSFLYSSGAILIVTAIAKLISSFGATRILQSPDPILLLSYQKVFWIVGSIELIVAITCFFSRKVGLPVMLLACLSTSFLLYRVGLKCMGYQKPCGCLGNLTDSIHIAPATADFIMKIALAYMMIGSYVILFWLRNQGSRTSPVGCSAEPV